MSDMPNLGPIVFTVEGSFMDKPRLLMGGEDVPFDTMMIMYLPEEKMMFDGKEEVLPELITMEFSLKAQVGQLEANVNYRVKANADGKFVVAEAEKTARGKQQLKKTKKVKLPPEDKDPVNVQKKDPTVDPVPVETKAKKPFPPKKDEEKKDEKKGKDSPKSKDEKKSDDKDGEKPKFWEKKSKSEVEPDAATRAYKSKLHQTIIENLIDHD